MEIIERIKVVSEAAAAATAAVVAIMGLFGGGAWVSKFRARRRRAITVAERVRACSAINNPLNTIALSVGATRAVILVAENGSKYFPSYVTIVQQFILEKGVSDRMAEWQRRRVDWTYDTKIGRFAMGADEYAVIKASEIPIGQLRDMYEADGIVATIVIPLLKSHVDDWSVYASISCRHIPKITATERDAIRNFAYKARTILRAALPF